jgi:tRNA(Ile2) C34 agmatinyltransferase TiaS
MEEITCPNCNVDTDPEELRRNNLRCPTCGYDMSEAEELEHFDEEEDWEEEDYDEEDEEELERD